MCANTGKVITLAPEVHMDGGLMEDCGDDMGTEDRGNVIERKEGIAIATGVVSQSS